MTVNKITLPGTISVSFACISTTIFPIFVPDDTLRQMCNIENESWKSRKSCTYFLAFTYVKNKVGALGFSNTQRN